MNKLITKKTEIKRGMEYLQNHFLTPSKENIAFLESINEDKIADKTSYQNIVSRSSFTYDKLDALDEYFKNISNEAKEEISINAKYDRYIQKQQKQIAKMKELLNIKIPNDFNYIGISGLSNEIIEKLSKHKPQTLFEASNISGVTPSAIDIIHLYIQLKRKKIKT